MTNFFEGIENIETICYLKHNKTKKIIYYIISILTFFITSLIMKLNPILRKKIYDETKNIEEADIIFLIFEDNKLKILDIIKKQRKIYREEKVENFLFVKLNNIWNYYCYEKKIFLIYNSKFLEFLNENSGNLKNIIKPLKKEDYERNFDFWGTNSFAISKKPLYIHLADQILTPLWFFFLILQIIFIITEEYGLTLSFILDMIFITYVQRNNYLVQINKINSFVDKSVFCNVLRNEKVEGEEKFVNVRKKIDCNFLTQGDIVEITNNQILNFDGLILSGDCLVDQNSLTGEITPIFKKNFTEGEKLKKKNIIFSGSKIVEKKSEKIFVLVLSTGYNSFQGKMIANLLDEKTKNLKIEGDFIKIFSIFFIINSIVLTTKYLFDYYDEKDILLKDIMTRYTQLLKESFSIIFSSWSIIYLTDLVSSYNLKELDIHKIRPHHISIAGRMKVICFDKTGTLTEDSMKLFGYVLSTDKKNFDMKVIDEEFDFLKECEDMVFYDVLACCHHLFIINDEIFGDAMEKEMLNLTKFELVLNENKVKNNLENELVSDNIFEIKDDNEEVNFNQKIKPSKEFIKKFGLSDDFEYEILKIFHFDHGKKMMSVIIENPLKKGKYIYLAKGAPEVMKNLCKPETIPNNYDRNIESLDKRALRVICAAYKEIDNLDIHLKDLEKDLIFNSLLVYENSLKKGVKESMESFRKCGFLVNIITGDSMINAISVGYKIGMIKKSKAIFLVDYNTNKKELVIKRCENEKIYKDMNQDSENNNILSAIHVSLLEENKEEEKFFIESMLVECKIKKSKIAINGKFLEFLIKKYENDFKTLKRIFKHIAIFARSKPKHKKLAVKIYKEIQNIKNYTVGFVGDGANDAEALNEADIGFSIANEFTSIVAGFYTKSDKIEKMHDISIEGKYNLKNVQEMIYYMVFYTIIKLTTILLLAFLNLNFSMNDYIYRTFAYFLIFIAVSFVRSSKKKSLYYPDFSILNNKRVFYMISMIVIIICNALMFFYNIILDKRYKTIYDIINYDKKFVNEDFFFVEGRILIFYSLYLSPIFMCFFFHSFPFKKNVFSNRWIILLVSFTVLLMFCLFFNEIFVTNYYFEKYFIIMFSLPNMSLKFRIKIFFMNIILSSITMFSNKIIETYDIIMKSKNAHQIYFKRLRIKDNIKVLGSSGN